MDKELNITQEQSITNKKRMNNINDSQVKCISYKQYSDLILMYCFMVHV